MKSSHTEPPNEEDGKALCGIDYGNHSKYWRHNQGLNKIENCHRLFQILETSLDNRRDRNAAGYQDYTYPRADFCTKQCHSQAPAKCANQPLPPVQSKSAQTEPTSGTRPQKRTNMKRNTGQMVRGRAADIHHRKRYGETDKSS